MSFLLGPLSLLLSVLSAEAPDLLHVRTRVIATLGGRDVGTILSTSLQTSQSNFTELATYRDCVRSIME